MTFIKTTLWTGASVLIKAMSVFCFAKVVAIYTGPVGLALTEQFQNFILMVRTFSGNLIQQGIVKYTVEYKNNEPAKARVLSSAAVITVITSCLFSTAVLCYSGKISTWMLQTDAYQPVIIALAFSIIFFTLNNFFLAILNGQIEIRKYALCNMANTVLFLFISLYAVIYHGLTGALIALVLNQSIVFLLSGYFVLRSKWFKWDTFIQGIDKDSLFKFTNYAIIMIVTTLLVPLAQIIIRKYIAHTLSWQDAGYWQGITKLSNNYQIIIDATFSIYFLPRFAQIKTALELKKTILQCYNYLFPTAIITAIFVYFFRNQIIVLLYSQSFLEMEYLFKYQLIGDVARAGAWLLMYVMISKTMVKGIIATEIAFFIMYTASTIIFTHYYGLIGTAMGFAVSYIFYWLSMLSFTARYIHLETRQETHKEMIPHANFQTLEESR